MEDSLNKKTAKREASTKDKKEKMLIMSQQYERLSMNIRQLRQLHGET